MPRRRRRGLRRLPWGTPGKRERNSKETAAGRDTLDKHTTFFCSATKAQTSSLPP